MVHMAPISKLKYANEAVETKKEAIMVPQCATLQYQRPPKLQRQRCENEMTNTSEEFVLYFHRANSV